MNLKFNCFNFDIDHNDFNYEQFVVIYNNNTFDKIDMNLKKFQRYYIRILFKLKIAIDKINAIQIFKKNLERMLILN